MTRPFPVDPAVMDRIRPMQFRDAARVAELHHAAMGRSTWARLGRPFLVALYRVLVDAPGFLGFVYVEDGSVRGFIAGTTDTREMYRHIRRHRAHLLAGPAVLGIVRSPRLGIELFQTQRYFSDDTARDVSAESLFCSFEPELRGTRVSGHVNKVLFDELLARGHARVKVSTEVDNIGANRQLQSWGFEVAGRFSFYGKGMVTYVLDLAGSPRVEAVSRHPAV